MPGSHLYGRGTSLLEGQSRTGKIPSSGKKVQRKGPAVTSDNVQVGKKEEMALENSFQLSAEGYCLATPQWREEGGP